mgnify:CR=1 FL=1
MMIYVRDSCSRSIRLAQNNTQTSHCLSLTILDCSESVSVGARMYLFTHVLLLPLTTTLYLSQQF